MDGIKWEKAASMAICFGVGALLVGLAFHYLLPILIPFLIAYATSLLIKPPALRLSKRTHLPQRACAAVLLTLFLGGALCLIGLSVGRLFSELEHLLERLLAADGEFEGLVRESIDFFDTVTSRVGFLRRIGAGERFASLRESFNQTVADMLGNLLNALSAELPSFLGRVLSALPSVMLVTIVTVIAAFCFCMDEGGVAEGLLRFLPHGVRKKLPVWKKQIKRLSWKYLRAYLFLLALTFATLFLGFSILRIEYAFLLALVVAIVDLLPVLGVGTVLLPWAAVLLIRRQFYLGFGLLILYFAVFLMRQIMEPRLVGRSLGLHPLLTLFASYAGWQLFGFFGMVFGPVTALLIKSLFSQWERLRQS